MKKTNLNIVIGHGKTFQNLINVGPLIRPGKKSKINKRRAPDSRVWALGTMSRVNKLYTKFNHAPCKRRRISHFLGWGGGR